MPLPHINLLMGNLNFLNSEDYKPDLWLGFMNIFLLWIYAHYSLLLLFDHHYSSEFIWSISSSHVTFLGINKHVDKLSLHILLHVKPTIISTSSVKFPFTKCSLPFSQGIHDRHMCALDLSNLIFCLPSLHFSSSLHCQIHHTSPPSQNWVAAGWNKLLRFFSTFRGHP